MQFAEFGGVVAAEIDEEQFVGPLLQYILCQHDVEPVGLLDCAPAIQVQAFRIAPPLLAQIVVAILRRLADRKAHIVQLDIRVAAIAADIEHVKLHRHACSLPARANAGSRFDCHFFRRNDGGRKRYKAF